jgi:hypothetical protein
MSYQIVKSKNNFYIYDGHNFYRSFHSLADAEYNIKNLSRSSNLKLSENLIDFRVLMNIYIYITSLN